jgi:hypothetical protein
MLAACVLMTLIIAVEINVLGGDAGAATAGAESAPLDDPALGAKAEPLQIPPVVAYREVVERPLFTDSRRPPEKAPEEVAESKRIAQLVGKWKVTGIVVAGDHSFAHVEASTDHKTVRLQVGMMLDGWKLEAIRADGIVFRSGAESTTLTLHDEEPKVKPIRRRQG